MGQKGLEPALRDLLRHGVYLSVDEVKGRQPVVRGSLTVPVHPDMARNPLARRHVPVASSGSRGSPTMTLMDLAFVRDHGVNVCLALEAAGGSDWVKAVYAVPGGAALYRMLKLSSFGTRVARWFTQVDPATPGLDPRYRWSHRLVRWTSLAAGVPLPDPVPRPARRPAPRRALDGRGRPARRDTVGADAPELRRASLPGRGRRRGRPAQAPSLTVSGEPVTEASSTPIRRSGRRGAPGTAR